MIRIYMTPNGLEGYRYSCCSFTESATVEDIKELCNKLESQRQILFMLLEILDDHTEDELTYWYKTYLEIRDLEVQIQAAETYKQNPNIQGTYHKESFDKVQENSKNLLFLKKKYAKFPTIFKKYIKELEGKQ